MKKDSLGDRMKRYERVSSSYLTRRLPVVIRLDGKGFHSFTKGMNKPFDDILIEAMQETAKYLCKNIQGCKIAYTQSDEISLLLTDYENLDTCGWFDNNVQKMVSVSASMATLAFNKSYRKIFERDFILPIEKSVSSEQEFQEYVKQYNIYHQKIDTALFDSRVFILPKEEVVNCFIWRQQDAIRNSIQMVGQANFSHKELNGKSCDDIKEMLIDEKNIDWNNIPTHQKRGACIIKKTYELDNEENTIRNKWVVDGDIPIFTEDRNYIEKYLQSGVFNLLELL